jgi:hypothetical protein
MFDGLFSYRLKRLFILTGSLLILLTSILEIWLANMVSDSGAQLVQLAIIKNQLILENQLLEVQIASQSSFLTIEQKAKNKGFIHPVTLPSYITTQGGMIHIITLLIATVLAIVLLLMLFSERPISLI